MNELASNTPKPKRKRRKPIKVTVNVPGSASGGGNLRNVASRPLSQCEDAGELRLSGSTESEPAPHQSVDARGVHRESGVGHLDRTAGDGKDALGNGTGNQGVPDGKEGSLLQGERSDYPAAGGSRGEDALADEKESGDAGRADLGRVGICPGKQGGERIIV